MTGRGDSAAELGAGVQERVTFQGLALCNICAAPGVRVTAFLLFSIKT